MVKVIKLTESDLYRIVTRVMTESSMAAEQGLSKEQKQMIKKYLSRKDLRVLNMMLDKYGESKLKNIMIDVVNDLVSGGGIATEKPGRPEMDDSEQMASIKEYEDVSNEEIKKDKYRLSSILQKIVAGGILASFVAIGADFPTVGVVTYILSMIPMVVLSKIHNY